jgi:hypothetical protein
VFCACLASLSNKKSSSDISRNSTFITPGGPETEMRKTKNLPLWDASVVGSLSNSLGG